MINPLFITHTEVIDKLTKDQRFKSICKGIAKQPYKADELYQEFFLALCEIKDNRLVKANDGGYLEVLCIGIINNIWGKRFRVKTYTNGSTSPLYEMSNSTKVITPERAVFVDDKVFYGETKGEAVAESLIPSPEEEYNHRIDHEHNIVRNIIERERESQDKNDRFRARVFDYSHTLFKNPKQFSNHTHIPYRVTMLAYHEFKNKLQKELSLCRIL